MSHPAEAIESPEDRRAVERRAFDKVTRSMIDAGEDTGSFAWRHSIETNRLFWSVLKDNVFAEDNRLTNELKGQLVSLATWVERYTDRVLRGEAKGIAPLISVNDTIMSGMA